MHLYDHVEVHMQASRCFSEGPEAVVRGKGQKEKYIVALEKAGGRAVLMVGTSSCRRLALPHTLELL